MGDLGGWVIRDLASSLFDAQKTSLAEGQSWLLDPRPS